MQLEADPPPAAAALEHEQVAAVGVDVHQVRIQRAHAQQRCATPRHVRRRGVRHEASPPCCRRARSVGATLPRPAQRAQSRPTRLALQLGGARGGRARSRALEPAARPCGARVARRPASRCARRPGLRSGARVRSGSCARRARTRVARLHVEDAVATRAVSGVGPRSPAAAVERLDVGDDRAGEQAARRAGGRARARRNAAARRGRRAAGRSASAPGTGRSRAAPARSERASAHDGLQRSQAGGALASARASSSGSTSRAITDVPVRGRGRGSRGRCRRRCRGSARPSVGAARRPARATARGRRGRSRTRGRARSPPGTRAAAGRQAASPRAAAPPRARPAARAARASRCRWAARTGARRASGRSAAASRRAPRAGPACDVDRVGIDARVLQPHRQLGRAGAAAGDARRTRPASSSKSASQIQDTSRPSAMLSLSTPSRSCSPGSSASVRSTSLAPAGFLTSRIRSSRGAGAAGCPSAARRGA